MPPGAFFATLTANLPEPLEFTWSPTLPAQLPASLALIISLGILSAASSPFGSIILTLSSSSRGTS